jgi:diguanylate cyclase (GGDEF)-like protein/PAS domain S-box-containing protein
MAVAEGSEGGTPLRLLIVEDLPEDAELVARALRLDGVGVDPKVVDSETAFLAGLAGSPDVIISGFSLSGLDGRRALTLALASGSDAPFIVVSAVLREEDAVELLRRGASDYLLKDRLAGLGGAVRQAIERRDLSRRERAAIEALRRSERRFRSLVQNGSGVIAALDADGIVSYMSPSIEPLSGFPPGHYVGTPMLEHVFAEDLEEASLSLKDSMAEPGSVGAGRRRIRRRDGGVVTIECTLTNLLDDPDVGAVICNFYDVSGQEAAMASVRSSEERYRRIVESTQEAIMVLDLDGVITFASAGADRLFGVEPGALLTLSLGGIVDERGAQAAFLGGGARSARTEVPVSVCGTQRWFSVASDPLQDGDGREVGHLVLASDVTERRQADEDVRLQARLLESVGEAVFALDLDGTVIYWNAAATAMLGRQPAEAMGAHILALAAPGSEQMWQELYAAMSPTAFWSGELTMARADGATFPALMTTNPALDERGAAIGTMVVVVDMSVQDAAVTELALRARQQSAIAALGNRALGERDPASFLEGVVASATEELDVDRASVFALDETGELLVLRASVGVPAEMVGVLTMPASPDRVMGYVLGRHGPLAVADFAAPDATAGGVQASEEITALGVRSGIAVVVGGEDRPYGVLAVGSTEARTYTQQEIDFVTSLANVLAAAVERQRAEAELEHQAHHDLLTGLPNRLCFEERAAAVLAHAHAGGTTVLLLIDVDSLKLVSDALGQAIGDEVLRSVAARLVSAVDPPGLVARLGGDGLAVLADAKGGAVGAAALADSIATTLAPPHLVAGGIEVFAAPNIGLATTDDLAWDPHEPPAERLRVLDRHADLALQQAKRLGRGRIELFDRAMRDDAAARLSMATALRGAVERGEMSLRYQPEVVLAERGPLWAETLLRWDHPEFGSVPPDRFIPIAEESGTIIEIGAWVLREACRQLCSWRENGDPSPDVLSVNLSPRQLAHPDVVQMVATVLDEEQLDASALTLEITETAVMSDPERALETVRQLRDLGVLIAIDDFGTGYSSLALLQRFPVTALKIDRTFVAGLGVHESDRSIVAAVIGLAEALGVVTVAEGVETAAQLAMLTEMGCDFGQGYLWAKPMLPDDMVCWMRGDLRDRVGPEA